VVNDDIAETQELGSVLKEKKGKETLQRERKGARTRKKINSTRE